MTLNHNNSEFYRLSLLIQGQVQGVGFRPYIYKLAKQLELKGWVNNTLAGVLIEIEGQQHQLDQFLYQVKNNKPTNAEVTNITTQNLPAIGYQDFTITTSNNSLDNNKTAILPDIATCQDCLTETLDPNNRRYLYPFTNCINCGPRFSIIEALPYDRSNTTMKNFSMCEDCLAEYSDPENRRFHAQPNACASCGPQLEFWDRKGKIIATKIEALQLAIESINSSKIIAIKQTGGFHLVVDAANKLSVMELRKRKHRNEKPFALLYPNISLVKEHCVISDLESKLLTSKIAPIVLLKQLKQIKGLASLASNIAPENPYLGVMLPNNPLQHLLMNALQRPVVATSGNISDEPICSDNQEALEALSNIADGFLVNNRPISQAIDDSIVQVVLEREMVLRRARGYPSLLMNIKINNLEPRVLAVGGHLKNTIAMSVGNSVYLSQHIGDLQTEKAFNNFEQIINKTQTIYKQTPKVIVCDRHSEYLSSKYAYSQNLPTTTVQHHQAHILSCMAEHNLSNNVLGVAWDGSGAGLDGNVWGGEFFLVAQNTFTRVAHLRTFPLIGGDQAIKEPRRIALGLLYEAFGDKVFEQDFLRFTKNFSSLEINIFKQMLKNHINLPLTSSVGRLFDAIAAILGLQQKSNYEAQAAMKLEFALAEIPETTESYSFKLIKNKISYNSVNPFIIDWQELLIQVLSDVGQNIPTSFIAAKFHNALVNSIVEVTKVIGEKAVVLSGGCFQNRYLLEKTVLALRLAGFFPYWQQKIPTNDGGIALGQLFATINS